jgi:allantoicase
MPGRAHNMSDGWETRRRRGPGHDWVIVQLAAEAVVRRIEVDTNHFKGNYPDTAWIEGCRSDEWFDVLPRTKLQAHTRHMFVDELMNRGPLTQLRLNVFPDGGVSRLRVHAAATEAGRQAAVVRRINTLADADAELRSTCASTEWVKTMAAARPFASWDELVRAADDAWWSVDAMQWREAFLAHPRIGEKNAAGWAAEEQSGAATASAQTLLALEEINRRYEERFDHTYIVCATGRSADEMLALAQLRIANDAETELRVAGEEQLKIAKLRLMKLVG